MCFCSPSVKNWALQASSIDESNARGGRRKSLDLSAPPGARQVLQQDFHSIGDKTSEAKIEWSDIRNRSLSGYLA